MLQPSNSTVTIDCEVIDWRILSCSITWTDRGRLHARFIWAGMHGRNIKIQPNAHEKCSKTLDL